MMKLNTYYYRPAKRDKQTYTPSEPQSKTTITVLLIQKLKHSLHQYIK
jgi:hypothetical protein